MNADAQEAEMVYASTAHSLGGHCSSNPACDTLLLLQQMSLVTGLTRGAVLVPIT
jgi:hypothetical protein